MPHPDGGRGNAFQTTRTFNGAYDYVSPIGVDFQSTTNETIHAKRGLENVRQSIQKSVPKKRVECSVYI